MGGGMYWAVVRGEGGGSTATLFGVGAQAARGIGDLRAQVTLCDGGGWSCCNVRSATLRELSAGMRADAQSG